MDAGEHQESDLGEPKLRIFEFPSDSKGSRAGKRGQHAESLGFTWENQGFRPEMLILHRKMGADR